jgi:hypothetical protein
MDIGFGKYQTINGRWLEDYWVLALGVLGIPLGISRERGRLV